MDTQFYYFTNFVTIVSAFSIGSQAPLIFEAAISQESLTDLTEVISLFLWGILLVWGMVLTFKVLAIT